MQGLSDRSQAVLTLVSASLIAVGAYSVPAGADPKIGLGLGLLGAVGFGLKEALGTKAQPPQASQPSA